MGCDPDPCCRNYNGGYHDCRAGFPDRWQGTRPAAPDIRPLLIRDLIARGLTEEFAIEMIDWATERGDQLRQLRIQEGR